MEAIAGATLAMSGCVNGVGLVVGPWVTFHGLDTAQAGIRTMFSGQPTDTMTSTAIQSFGVDRDTANFWDGVIGMLGTWGAGALKGGCFLSDNDVLDFDGVPAVIASANGWCISHFIAGAIIGVAAAAHWDGKRRRKLNLLPVDDTGHTIPRHRLRFEELLTGRRNFRLADVAI